MFSSNTSVSFDRTHTRWPTGGPLVVCVGVLFAMTANDACAAALGNLVTSVGLFAALAALFAIKGWPAQLPASALSTAAGALVIAGGAAWWWRVRSAGRSSSFAGRPGSIEVGSAPALAGRQVARPASVQLPASFDREALLAELRLIFVRLQEAWDLGAMASLQTLTTSDMLEELCLGLPGCSQDGAAARTDVVTLRAELFAFEEMAGAFVASVEFSGLMRESPGQCAAPFRELWMLTKSKGGETGWKLARHQALL
jgi:predicted lipid-binding transport protein (Tim44 family)